jgi:Flp pilus assembly pilin Flp
MKMFLVRLRQEEDGQALVEYALLVALVVLVSWPALSAIQAALQTAYVGWNNAETGFWQMPPCSAC